MVSSDLGGTMTMTIYPIKEIPGVENKTLEQVQNEIFMQLARLIAEAIRQEQQLSNGKTHDTISPDQKPEAVSNV